MRLEKIINENYSYLNDNEKQIIQNIIQNHNEYQNMTSTQIANHCHMSRASLLRLCNKLGLTSFSDLKLLLREMGDISTSKEDDFQQICEHYHLLIDELMKNSFQSICKKIYKANTIYIYGTGNEQKSIAEEFKRNFLSIGKTVIEVFDEGELDLMKCNFVKDDLFVIISLSGETKSGIRIVHSIRNLLGTLSITRLDNNTISTLCQFNLNVSTSKLDAVQATSYEVVGAFYALLDLLTIQYFEYWRKQQ